MINGDITIFFDIYKSGKRLIPFKLDVYKYSFPDFLKENKLREKDFSLDILDIAYYTARTICSYNLSREEQYFDIISSLLSHLNFIDLNGDNLTLSESRYKRLRDFSKSTRIGEMAQGINTFFVVDRLGFPYFIDYDLAKEKTSIGFKNKSKSPDFVILNSSLSKIGLYESKGNMNGTPSKDLKSALTQINHVYNPPCIDYKVPVCTRFQNNNDFSMKKPRKPRKSSINYALIETDCSDPKDYTTLKKLHYASWFYLVGDFTRVNAILEENNIPEINQEDPFYELDTTTDKENLIYWVKSPLNFNYSNSFNELYIYLNNWSRKKNNFRIGIYKSVIDNLVSNSNDRFLLPEGDINNLKKYPDGTLFYLNLDE